MRQFGPLGFTNVGQQAPGRTDRKRQVLALESGQIADTELLCQ